MQPSVPQPEPCDSLSVEEKAVKFPLQTDHRFSEVFQRYGCNVMVMAKHCFDKGCEFSEDIVSTIKAVSEEAVKKRFCSEKFLIRHYNELYDLFGLEVWYTDRHESPNRVCADDEIEHLFYQARRAGELQGHFVQGNGGGGINYDPMGESWTVKNGWLASKRIFKVIGRL